MHQPPRGRRCVLRARRTCVVGAAALLLVVPPPSTPWAWAPAAVVAGFRPAAAPASRRAVPRVVAPEGGTPGRRPPRAAAAAVPVLAATDDGHENESEAEVDRKLNEVAARLKLEVFDLDGGLFGFESKDHRYGLEVVRTTVVPDPDTQGLGLVLTEVAGSADGRGLVLVSGISGAALKADPPVRVGDALTGVSCGPARIRTTGLNYDRTVESIGQAKECLGPSSPGLTLELNRLVPRAAVAVVVEEPGSEGSLTIQALAGENLRRLLLRKGIRLYDSDTRRFDMPYARGDCAGEGLCGTCLVDVREGMDLLNPPTDQERLITRGRPLTWRASCRAVVGPDNRPGTVRIRTRPQSAFLDELDPGVRSLELEP